MGNPDNCAQARASTLKISPSKNKINRMMAENSNKKRLCLIHRQIIISIKSKHSSRPMRKKTNKDDIDKMQIKNFERLSHI
jgi:hypothetical protein